MSFYYSTRQTVFFDSREQYVPAYISGLPQESRIIPVKYIKIETPHLFLENERIKVNKINCTFRVGEASE